MKLETFNNRCWKIPFFGSKEMSDKAIEKLYVEVTKAKRPTTRKPLTKPQGNEKDTQ